MKNIFTFIVLFFITVATYSQNNKDDGVFTGTITILHTNDIHSNLSRFPRLAFVVDSIRQANENVLLLNAGDIFTGNPLVDMNKERGFQMIELMNRLKYDVSAIGNHDFDYGQEVFLKRRKEANFEFICANIWNDSKQFPLPGSVQYVKIRNCSINIIGLLDISNGGIPETHPMRIKGLLFTDPVETALKFDHALRTNVDLYIALTHLGIKQDIELAQRVPSIDVIVGAHSHSVIDSVLLVNDVLITQAGKSLKCLGEIKIELDSGKVVSKTSKLIKLDESGSVDNEMKQLTKQYESDLLFEEVVGLAQKDLAGKEQLGCFFTDALRSEANVDIAFQNSGGIRIDTLHAGEIKMEDIFRLDPFGNYLMILEMTLAEIKSLIRYSFKHEGIDLRVSGLLYTITTENGTIKNIDITDYQGKGLDPKRKYKVAMNDYILSSYKFEHVDNGQSFGTTTAEALISYLKKQRSIGYENVQRTFLKEER